MTAVVAAVGVLAALLCLEGPDLGVPVCLIAGFLADPLRKTLPGEPVILTAAIVGFVGLTFVGALKKGSRLRMPSVLRKDRRTIGAFRIFAAIVLLQALVSYARTRSTMIAGIGLLAYFAPIPAIFVGYRFARRPGRLERFVGIYTLVCCAGVLGIYLSIAGVDHPLLNAVGVEQVVYSRVTGGPVRLLCGFFRSSENAAWHAATAFSLLLLLAVTRLRRRAADWFYVPAMVFLAIAVPLTGRRKAMVTIVLFAVLYGFLLAYFRRGAHRLATNALVVGLAVTVIAGSTFLSDPEAIRPYIERGATATGESLVGRLEKMTIGSFKWVVQANGIFGAGAGIGSQGSQHFGGGVDMVGMAAEGGLAKVLAELGLPGIVAFLWFAWVLGRRLWKAFASVNRGDPARSRLILGLAALIVANGIEFVTATQIFGDPFVLVMLGWLFGFLLAAMDTQLDAVAEPPPAPVPAPESRVVHLPITGVPGLDLP